jgi:hypothetical protein
MLLSQQSIVGLLSGLIASTLTLSDVKFGNNNSISVIAQTASNGFVTPSGNIYCALQGGDEKALRCEIKSGLNPTPPQPYSGYCELDWGAGFSLTSYSKPEILCISDTIYGGNYPKLSYGSTWRNGGFKCLSQRAGLICTNTSGQGFFLSRERWKILVNQ